MTRDPKCVAGERPAPGEPLVHLDSAGSASHETDLRRTHHPGDARNRAASHTARARLALRRILAWRATRATPAAEGRDTIPVRGGHTGASPRGSQRRRNRDADSAESQHRIVPARIARPLPTSPLPTLPLRISPASRRAAAAALGVTLGLAVGMAIDVAPQTAPGLVAAPAVPVVGVYKVRIRGDGWTSHRTGSGGAAPTIRQERVNGFASVVVRARDGQDAGGMYTVEVVIDPALQPSVLGESTPGKPAFRGTAALQGDWLSVMDEGTQPGANAGLWVNALNLRFENGSKKVSGSWSALFPAREPDLATQGFASGVFVTFTGRRSAKVGR